MVTSVRKTIPDTSDFYGTGGDQTIVINGTYEVITHSKKDLIKFNRRKSKSRQASSPSDIFDNQVIDLKNGVDEIVLRCWLEDDNDGGNATAGASTTMTNSGASWEVNQYTGATVSIISGTGSGQSKTIVSNTSTVLTVDSSWSTNPDATSVYEITQTAWEKYWRLRAMLSTGGALTSFILENITFSSSTQEAFLEDITGNIKGNDTGVINESAGDGVARMDVGLSFFIGDAR